MYLKGTRGWEIENKNNSSTISSSSSLHHMIPYSKFKSNIDKVIPKDKDKMAVLKQ